jgi:uncharacterized membrane protein
VEQLPWNARQRLASLDILRGLVIVLMVLDHTRDFPHIDAVRFDPLDPSRTTALLYATRWITHLCAPTFVFLAGTSAWLQRARGKTPRELSRFLLTRGLWLVVLELTVIGFAWSFSLPFMFLLQVVWAIGWSMVVLAALVWLPRPLVLGLGVLILAGHNLLDPIKPAQWGAWGDLWTALHVPGLWSHAGAPYALDAYPLLPWCGVLLFGYGMGPVFLAPGARRTRLLTGLGLGMIALFLVLRYFNLYGDPNTWGPRPTLTQSAMDFFGVEKYPPSLLYVCATLGPVFVLIPLIEHWHGRAARFFMVFGAVPLFAYVLHLYLVHAAAIGLRLASGQSLVGQFDELRMNVLHRSLLEGSGFPLAVVYATWIGIVLALYPACRWYAGVKARRHDWWLSYL